MVSTELRCNAGGIIPKKGSRAGIRVGGFLRRKVNGNNKAESHLEGIPIAWSIGKRPTAGTSSYEWEIHAAFYGSDTDRPLKGFVAGFLFVKEGVFGGKEAKNDNLAL